MWKIAAEIGMFDGYIVVYKFISDLHFYVTGSDDDNELILATVLQGFFDAVSMLLRFVKTVWFFCSALKQFFLWSRFMQIWFQPCRRVCWELFQSQFTVLICFTEAS